jgi:MATE family multidrug resistance protein
MLALAGPVVLAELGWVAMGTVDTMMVGRVSAEAIGAVSLGSMLFLAVAIFGMGLLLGLDTLVSQAYGAGDLPDCHRSLFHGFYLSLLLAPILTRMSWR